MMQQSRNVLVGWLADSSEGNIVVLDQPEKACLSTVINARREWRTG
jgi:hypothetical protein